MRESLFCVHVLHVNKISIKPMLFWYFCFELAHTLVFPTFSAPWSPVADFIVAPLHVVSCGRFHRGPRSCGLPWSQAIGSQAIGSQGIWYRNQWYGIQWYRNQWYGIQWYGNHWFGNPASYEISLFRVFCRQGVIIYLYLFIYLFMYSFIYVYHCHCRVIVLFLNCIFICFYKCIHSFIILIN